MNPMIRFRANSAIFVAEKKMKNIGLAVDALRKIVEAVNIIDQLDPMGQINEAIGKMPEFDEDLTTDLIKIRELLEEEIADPVCNGCGLTAMVATEGGQGEQRGCKCDPQKENDHVDAEL